MEVDYYYMDTSAFPPSSQLTGSQFVQRERERQTAPLQHDYIQWENSQPDSGPLRGLIYEAKNSPTIPLREFALFFGSGSGSAFALQLCEVFLFCDMRADGVLRSQLFVTHHRKRTVDRVLPQSGILQRS